MLKPLEDHVVLALEKKERTTQSGIILASDDKDKPAIGKVLAIGPKVENIDLEDRVVYQSYSGTKVVLDEKEFLLIQAKHILAKII